MKLMESNVSDILAMGGKPDYAFLSLSLKKDTIDIMKRIKETYYLATTEFPAAKLSLRLISSDTYEIIDRVVSDLGGTERPVVRSIALVDGAVVLGDPLSIRRVLENLVSNAIDSLESRAGEVAVSTEVVDSDTGRRVRIVVADTGGGMSGEQREKIFDDFYTTKDGGTGLGLSIVRRLVMDLDGTIEVESEPGRGSRFVVELPEVDSASESL